jgi:hypothetical protein
MQHGKAATAWHTGPVSVGLGSSPGGSIYFYSILLNFIVNFVFIINVFDQNLLFILISIIILLFYIYKIIFLNLFYFILRFIYIY